MRRHGLVRRLVLSATLSATLLAALGVGSMAEATVVREMSRAELVGHSDLVVRATILDHHSEWNENHTQILTLTRIRVESYIKGAGPQELVLRQFGGTVDGMTAQVPGDGTFLQGEDTVLFLRRGVGGIAFLTALAQSVYHVDHAHAPAPTVARQLGDLTLARFPTQGATQLVPAPADPPETLAHLVQDLQALAHGAP